MRNTLPGSNFSARLRDSARLSLVVDLIE